MALVWTDVAAVALQAWQWLPLLGVIALAGVLLQSIVATLTYLAPMLRGRSFAARDLLLARLETGATARTVVFNVGIVAILCGGLLHLAGVDGTGPTHGGWGLVVLALLHPTAAGLRPVGRVDDDEARSGVARRYRAA